MSLEKSPLETLTREHRVIRDLLDRLMDLGERIRTGDRVSPGTVRLGVGLLDAYLHRVHARQFDVELWPEALAVATPSCRTPLDTVLDSHGRMRQSAQEILQLTSRWANGDWCAQDEVAQKLMDLAANDEAANEFEEHHPFVCLASALPSGAQQRLSAEFAGHAQTKGALEANITRFLDVSRTIPSEA